MADKSKPNKEPIDINNGTASTTDAANEQAVANNLSEKEKEAIPDNVKVAAADRNSIIWSWLGYSSSSNNSIKDNQSLADTNPPKIEEATVAAKDNAQVTDNNESPQEEASKDQGKPASDSRTEQQQQQLSRKKSMTGSQTGRLKSVVLPTFQSQFSQPKCPPTPSTTTSYVNRIIDTFTSFFTQKSQERIGIQQQHPFFESIKQNPATFGDKKIVVVGVHGWFPMKLVRSMVGEPTGTSEKFCQEMEAAAKRYFELEFSIAIPETSITSIPLKWEGKVLERVENLHDQIVNSNGENEDKTGWKDALQRADIILWATHSQGTPVSTILMKRLLDEGILQTDKQHICLLAMAGISHGPFPSIKDHLFVKYFEASAARELFDFMDSESSISVQYRDSMAFLLQQHVKVVLVGSMDDQVVPLYSALMSGISHPNILRAFFIDGQLYAEDDFLIRLITFAIRLLNAGLSDHGFLTHISELLAGNFYSWNGGHSTIYEEMDVFMLPLDYLFKTKPFGSFRMKTVAQQLQERTLDKVKAQFEPFQAKHKLNPFHLPWSLRGIWDDPHILQNEDLSCELKKIQELFDKWSPTTAKLKNIKFRLEPLRARL